MSGYIHLGRYGRKPGAAQVAAVDILGDGEVLYGGHRWNLRTAEKGDKVEGFAHTTDGRYLAWNDGKLEIHGPKGVVRAGAIVAGVRSPRIVGTFLVLDPDARNPWDVVDTTTGKVLGRVDAMRADSTFGTPLYNPGVFDPGDGATLWLGEKTRIALLDLASRTMKRELEPAPGFIFIGAPAALRDGHVLSLERPLDNVARFSRDGDRLVLFDPQGRRARERGITVSGMHVLGDGFIVVDDRAETLVILDRSLEAIERIHMFEPGRDGFMLIKPLPSGREWIGIGGRGEWDHYGEPGLGKPVKPPPAPKAKTAKGAAKKDAAKKATKK